MRSLKFKKIDAFATSTSSGNPAGAIYLDDNEDISHDEMLKVAKELKTFVNEVGYLQKGANSDFELKYYSSEKEVDFCGHATIAIMYELINNNSKLLEKDIVTIKTNMGISEVFNRIKSENCVYISAPTPQFNNNYPDKDMIVKTLDIPLKELHPSLPIQIVNGGLWTLIIPLRKAKTIINLNPDFDKFKLLCNDMNVDIIAVVSDDVTDKSNKFRSRIFPPPFGYLEDPATGSGNSAIGYYMLKHNIWNGNAISIEQNNQQKNFNTIKILCTDNRILFGGSAITRITGNYQLQ